MDYSKITQEELTKRLQSLSDADKAFLASEDISNILEDIANAYDFDGEETEILKQLIALVILKIIPKGELKKELKDSLILEDQIVDFVVDAVQKSVFSILEEGVLPQAPLAPAFATAFDSSIPKQNAYVPPSPKPIAPQAPTPVIAPANNRITPIKEASAPTSFKPDGNKIASTPEPAPAPFIIHERSEVKPTAAPMQSFGTSKQTFIKPQFIPVGSTPPATARVQFGGQVIGARKDTAPKIVDYAIPKAQPQAPKPQPVNLKPLAKKADNVNLENVIDLKDLPK